MSPACPTWRGDLAVYVLGALDPEEAARVANHLESCADCREEYLELAPLPGLLSRIPASAPVGMTGPVSPSDPLLERLLRTAVEERRRTPDGVVPLPVAAGARRSRRRIGLVSVAAALAVLAGVGVGVGVAVSRESPRLVYRFSDAASQVHGSVQLLAEPTGTEIRLSIAGVPNDQKCTLVAVSRSGARVWAGTWNSTYSGTADVQGSAAIPTDQMAALIVESPVRVLVRVPL